MGGFSRVLAYPKVFKSEQAARVQRHQHFSPFHDVQSEGLCTEDDPLRLHPQGQHHPILILRQKRQAAPEREDGEEEDKSDFGLQKKCDDRKRQTQLSSAHHPTNKCSQFLKSF